MLDESRARLRCWLGIVLYCGLMRRTLAGVGVLLLAILLPGLQAVEKQYETGKIIRVEKKAHTRVLYYLVNTPITQDDPYYEVSIRFGDQVCIGEYTPRHAADTPPQTWEPGSEVLARVEKHHMYVKGSGGAEWDLMIVKRLPASDGKSTADPTPTKK